MMIKRYWKFYAEHGEGGCYLDEENVFIGTGMEASEEADRRTDIYENRTGGLITRVIMESQGIVTH